MDLTAHKIITAIERRIVHLSDSEKSQIEELIEAYDSSYWLDDIMKLQSLQGIDEAVVEDILSEYE
jgi:hypothetical protein